MKLIVVRVTLRPDWMFVVMCIKAIMVCILWFIVVIKDVISLVLIFFLFMVILVRQVTVRI